MPEELVGEKWPERGSASRTLDWSFGRPKAIQKRFNQSLTALLSRKYFTRVWMLQEVFRKQPKTITCCGNLFAPLEALFTLRQALYILQREPDYQSALAGIWSPYGSYDFPTRCASFLLDVSFLGQRASNMKQGLTTADGKDDLGEMLSMVSIFDCTDSRDRIYGALPLVDWQNQGPIYPDYLKAPFDLAQEVTSRTWLRGEFGTIGRIANLAVMFSLLGQDGDVDYLEQTACHIIT